MKLLLTKRVLGHIHAEHGPWETEAPEFIDNVHRFFCDGYGHLHIYKIREADEEIRRQEYVYAILPRGSWTDVRVTDPN